MALQLRSVTRRWFTLFAGWSLLMSVVIIAIGVRSYHKRNSFPEVMRHPGISIQSFSGRFCIGWVSAVRIWPSPFQIAVEVRNHPLHVQWQNNGIQPVQSIRSVAPVAELSNGFGFAVLSDRVAFGVPPDGWSAKMVVIPYWAIALVFLFAPLQRILTLHGRREFARGFCQQCGYDLRATPERCPECGTLASESK
jgi:hypothetical protein